MADNMVHWDDAVMLLHSQKKKDAYTFSRVEIMAKNHKFIEGPKKAKGTGMIYYLEQYDQEKDDKENYQLDQTTDFKDYGITDFKGYSIMLTPLASQSLIDFLP